MVGSSRIYRLGDSRLPMELQKIQKSLGDVQRPTGTEKERTLLNLQDTVGKLQIVVDGLEDASKFYTASVGTSHTGASWRPDPPSVVASSLTRKFRITVSGGSSGGSTIMTFSTTGYDRARALGGSASAVLSSVTALGGASNPGSAQRSWVVTMPTTGNYTFYAQAYPIDQYVTSIGLQIDVQPML